MGAPRTFPSIVKILQRDAGKVVTVDQIHRETGLTHQQVRSAITENRKRIPFWHDNINVLTRGHSWSMTPSAVVHVNSMVRTNSVKEIIDSVVPTTQSPEHDEPKASTNVKSPTKPRSRTPHKLAVGDLLEVIGYSGQDILARAEDSGQVYRVTEL